MPRKKAVLKTQRDDNGLIVTPKVEYVFNEDGMIDWRKMVKTEHLVPNRQRTQETDVSKLEDSQLLVLLAGFKELAQIRGFTSVEYDVHSPSSDYVVATCRINWIPNYETENNSVTFSAVGDASPNNTSNFAKYFLGPIAENRAFVRCVRNFLRINVTGADEIGSAQLTSNDAAADNASDPVGLLQQAMNEKGFSFEKVKSKLLAEKYPSAETIQSVKDIPKAKIFELIGRIKSAKA
tara:strand:- start:453 stop:1163 length:711 start_codon:yes stop_codon:yes gene_type:complete